MGNSRRYTIRFIKVHKELGMTITDNGTLAKPSKYKNKKTEFNGVVFDSQTELKRYKVLLELEKDGKIKELEYHKKFKLLDSIRTTEELVRGIVYESDFFYYDFALNNYVVEDVKSSMTVKLPDYIIKKKLMINKYPQYTFFENSKIKKYFKVI